MWPEFGITDKNIIKINILALWVTICNAIFYLLKRNNTMKKLFTIGFKEKPAETFFKIINEANVKKLVDIRLRPNTQLAGFTKPNHFKYFLERLNDCDYCHIPLMAPSKDILNDHLNNGLEWKDYERRFKKLINQRKIERLINEDEIDGAYLLCVEVEAVNCHRRLVAEYLQNYFKNIEIIHL